MKSLHKWAMIQDINKFNYEQMKLLIGDKISSIKKILKN
jgi:hypothetical protein